MAPQKRQAFLALRDNTPPGVSRRPQRVGPYTRMVTTDAAGRRICGRSMPERSPEDTAAIARANEEARVSTELNTELAKKLRKAKRELAVAKSRAQIAAGDAERARMLQAGSPLTPASTGTPVHGAYRVSPEGVHAKADIQAMLAKAAGRPGPSRPSPLK